MHRFILLFLFFLFHPPEQTPYQTYGTSLYLRTRGHSQLEWEEKQVTKPMKRDEDCLERKLPNWTFPKSTIAQCPNLSTGKLAPRHNWRAKDETIAMQDIEEKTHCLSNAH